MTWDMFGVPKTILVDNGSEFHGEALTRGCAEYGIALTYRPVARPRFGARIERLIGTMMGRIHLLPGSTYSSPTARGNYQSENEAKLTLAELNEWLYLEIAGAYHHDIHRTIGTTPAAAWAKSLARGTVPVLPADPTRFVIGFLPIVHRKLQRNPGQDVRNLRDIANPKVRGAALWTAHALLATCHTAASDRASGVAPQGRQAALFASAAAPNRHWLE